MSGTGKQHKAGAFDVRVVIAGLIGFYGVVLVLVGLFGDPEPEKTGGVNANLWTGIGLVVVALAFGVWARLRPVVVDEAALAKAHAEDGDRPPAH
jgi:hypothetical protein